MTTNSSQVALDERYLRYQATEPAVAQAPPGSLASVAPGASTSGVAARLPLEAGDLQRVGRYRLTARLGSGGMGVVYLGVAGDGRLVAVKLMRPELADNPEFRARFGREVAALARVRGARILRVIEAGADACGPFLVTEYAAGPSLAGHVDRHGPVRPGELCALAVGPRGWLATGPDAIWTSRDGLSWTLAGTHGITPQRPGDQVFVLTGTSGGFLAAGQAQAPGGKTQAVIWTSGDGVTWQRMTAAQAGLGDGVLSISYATSFGHDTVISGTLGDGASGTWLSTDGGQVWTPVTVPAGHGAGTGITGLAADGSGLVAVRPGTVGDGVAYFSPNGRRWQYSATSEWPAGSSPKW